ncbi:arsenite methyltransferase [Clostridium sp. BSD9I1]|uniref:arsenite methyltransferase n=1 Tax=Clostridium sp. BSD9I1 TaxID=2003589 RepID=UPI001645E708|nr:arsenite methyltransferase [Clostridium sp. BSD9I1]
MFNNKEEVRGHIRKRYAGVAKNASKGCGCGSGCCGGNENTLDYNPNYIEEVSNKIGYTKGDVNSVPEESNMGLGCGNPIAIAGLKEGEGVLDLGSGGGFDCFLARRQVGESGYVIGVDMTPEMIQLSRKNAEKSKYTNVEFRLGEIEYLPVRDKSIDVIISNCVINLSLDKEQVFREAYRVLKSGGRLSISDVIATAELPESMKQDLAMLCGCISGAEYSENIKNILEKVGFKDIKMTPKDNSKEIIKSWAPNTDVQDYVASFIIEAKKE